jgi:endonuclease/exonuclease/phosphatase (EEP) superfamily protein YafD
MEATEPTEATEPLASSETTDASGPTRSPETPESAPPPLPSQTTPAPQSTPAPPTLEEGATQRQKRRLPLWIAIIGWIVTAGLAVLALLRVVAWDDLEPLAVLNAGTVVVYLPVWVVALVALVGRRFVLAGVAVLVVAAQISFLLPELTATESLPQWAARAPSIRLLDANVYEKNPSMADYAKQIKAYKPQLLTMEEAITPDATQLQSAGALAGLPHRLELKRFDSKAFLIASKYPLSGGNVVYYDYQPLIVQTTVHLPSGTFSLWVVHTSAPIPGSYVQWKGSLAYVAKLVAARGISNLLVVGDFNATWNNRGFRSILTTGLIDGAAARGDAFAMTWSQKLGPLPPLVRIDHVLTGTGVTVTKIATGDGPGSDHRDEMATVAIKSR